MSSLTFQVGAGVETMPGIYTREIDLTQTVSSSSSTQCAMAGVFSWGPVNLPVLTFGEGSLAATFGPPTDGNYEHWFGAANFYAHADSMWVNRVVDNTAFNAVANTANVTSLPAHTVYNQADYDIKSPSFEAGVKFIAKYPGAKGNSIRIAVCGSAAQYDSSVNITNVGANTLFAGSNTQAVFTVGSNNATITLANTAALTGNTPQTYANAVAASLTVGDIITVGNSAIGTQQVRVTSIGVPLIANTAGTNTGYASISVGLDQVIKTADDFKTTTIARSWEFKNAVSAAPTQSWTVSQSGNTVANDLMHVIVVDEDGSFTGRANAIIEVFPNVSRATDAKNIDGDSVYYKKVINNTSAYIWAASDLTGLGTATSANIASATTSAPLSMSLVSGTDGGDQNSITLSAISTGYLPFANKDLYNLSSLLVPATRGGTYGEQLFNFVIDNVAEVLQNVIAFGSVPRATVVNNLDPLTAIKNFRSVVRRSSYAECDSGYKYMYDKYNDTYRFVSVAGDVAGISSATDVANDPWFSPAGYNRGQIKNIVKLAWAPNPAEQAELFANDINPIATTYSDGTFLMGDKTLLGQNSAFNSIGVRKLFNVIKTVIAKASKALLFEQNDEFTQSRFRSIVEPYLRDVKGRRGIGQYLVRCDDTNNTDQVKNNYQFVGDVFVKPLRSARFINLNFIAVNNIAEFTESV